MKIAVIDISSSSISLLVARAQDAEVLFRDRESLTLLHYLDGKSLSPRGVDKLAEAVAAMMETCRGVGADAVYVISTAALRAVKNFEQVREEILRRTGAPVNFIDAETEAYCDYIANRDYGKGAVLMDIGGASIEICDLGKDGADHRRCLRFGVQDLHSKFVEHIQPNEEEGKKILKYIRKKFDAERVPDRGFGTVVLAGATNLALYAVYAEYTGNKQQGERAMRYKKFKKLAEHLLGGTGRSRLILDAAPEKLHSVGIAALLVKAFVRRVGAENIVVSERGVKDGYLRLVVDGALQGAAVRLTGAEMPQAAKENERVSGSEGRADAAEKQGQPPATAPKRRGRPPKTAKGSEGETGAKAKKAEGAPKRRGRPPKAAQDIGTEGVKR